MAKILGLELLVGWAFLCLNLDSNRYRLEYLLGVRDAVNIYSSPAKTANIHGLKMSPRE